MSLDVEILSSTLLSLVQGDLQEALNTNCFPTFSTYFIDHVDVTAGSLSVTTAGVAQLSFPVNVFIVDQTSVVANANGTPPGALPPALGQATIGLALSVSGTVLSLACNSVALGSTISAFLGATETATVQTQLQTLIGTVGNIDLSSIFTKLGLPTPTTSTIVQSGSDLFVRFDPSGSPVDNLQKGQDWCLFLDSATLITLIEGFINGPIGKISQVTSHTTTATWAPSGTVPHINANVTGKMNVPDPLKGDFTMTFGVDFGVQSLIPFPDADLVEFVTWSFSISTGVFFIDSAIEAAVDAGFNPTLFGGTAIGPNEFSMEQSLPPLKLGSASFAYTSVTGLAAGMVLGGPVAGIPAISTAIVSFDVGQFPSEFTLIGFCEGGTPPATPANVSVTAAASYSGAGKLCAVSILSPPTTTIDLTPYLGLSPGPGTVTDSGSITLSFNAIVSQAVATAALPVELLVQTTRGVRCVNFGIPPAPQYGTDGNVTNYHQITIDNCPIAVDPWFQIFHAYNPQWTPDPPPDWVDNIVEVAGLQSSLITVTGIQTAELVTFNQALDGGLSVVSAGALGAATLPAVLAFRSVDEQAGLVRANRGALGALTTSTMLFQRVATLDTPGAVSHQLSGSPQGASVTTTFANGTTQTVLVDALGLLQSAANQVGTGGAPVGAAGAAPPSNAAQASAPVGTPVANPAWPLNLPGLVKVLSVPGFETAPVAVAQISDGTYLVVEREASGAIRVAGLVPRWPDIPPVSGGWAISSATGDRVAVFTVRSAAQTCCCCGPATPN